MSMQIRANSCNAVANRKQEVAFGVKYYKKNLAELDLAVVKLLREAKPAIESLEKKHNITAVVGDNRTVIENDLLPITVFETAAGDNKLAKKNKSLPRIVLEKVKELFHLEDNKIKIPEESGHSRVQ